MITRRQPLDADNLDNGCEIPVKASPTHIPTPLERLPEVERLVNTQLTDGVHPDDRMVSTLDDTYVALGDAISAVTDLAILCQRHLPTSLTRKAERALATLCELRDTVTPPAGPSSPF